MFLLERAANLGLLSPVQLELAKLRHNGWTYSRLQAHFQITNPNVLIHGIVRSCSGRYWDLAFTGGTDDYLSEMDQLEFREQVLERCKEISCMTCSTATDIAFTLKRSSLQRAACLLTQLNCPSLISHLEELTYPGDSWLRGFCSRIGVKICKPQTIELARRFYCNVPAITTFFDTFEALFHRDSRLIFNADETQLSTAKRFKVLAAKGKIPLVTAQTKFPHITGMVAFNAAGDCFKPLIILKDLRTLKNLKKFEGHCYFATSSSGWITKDIFLYWALLFCSELSLYRMSLPDDLQSEPVLLVLDGQKSRLSFEAAAVFETFNVDVLVLPSQTTHLLQPFDVAVASPLKVEFKRALDRSITRLDDIDPTKREKASLLREIIVAAFLDALSKAASLSNIRHGFEAAGMVPVDRNRPLSSQYAMQVPDDDVFRSISAGPEVGSMVLSSPEGLNYLYEHAFGRPIRSEDWQISLVVLSRRVFHNAVMEGKAISPLPPFFESIGNGAFQRINWPSTT